MLNKKILASLLALIMIVAAVPYSALAGDPLTITVGDVSVDFGSATASVDITVSGNTGIAMLGFNVNYDSTYLKLSTVTQHEDVFASENFLDSNISEDSYEFTAGNYKQDVTGNGKLITFNFALTSNCEAKKYDITITGIEAYTHNEDVLDAVAVNGGITINAAQESSPFEFAGAQIRTEGKQGLRYIFELDRETYALLDESQLPKTYDDTGIGFGSVIAPKSILGDAALTKETEGAQIVPAVKLFEEPSDVIKYTVCLIDTIPEKYNTEYVAVPYITYLDGGLEKTIYGTQTENVTIFNIAKIMYDDANVSTETKAYLYDEILSVVDPNYQK